MVTLRDLFYGGESLILYLSGLSLQTHPSLQRKATKSKNDRRKVNGRY